MSEPMEFVIIMSMRYMKPALMGLAHDWVEQNSPKEIPGATVCGRFTSHPTAA
jgi:hypothetical protein